jgi:iron complex outermembrane receptor protein
MRAWEAVHRALPLGAGRLEGVFGIQGESSRFSALGEEAFVPDTRSRQAAAFLLEQWSWGGQGQFSLGMRAERVRVDSDGDTQGSEPRFGPPQRRSYTPRSASLGAVVPLLAEWKASASWSYTERAPTSYELYANGVHAATGTFERGDLQQAKERGRNVDVTLQWERGADQLKVGVFHSRFANYIALVPTGEPDFVDDEDEAFPVHAFRGVRARLSGIEVDGAWRLLDGPRTLDLDSQASLVRGDNLSSGEPLPRIAPLRATLGLSLAQGPWTARAEVQHAARQSRVPSDDTATPSWTILNLAASYKATIASHDALWFVKLQNLGDRLAYNASTIATVRALSPLPGRGVMFGMRTVF